MKKYIIYQLTKLIANIIDIDNIESDMLMRACITFQNKYKR